MTSPRPVRRVDRQALQGLAHPLRVQLYDLLVSEGSATASELGRRLGESSGSTSYHLRQLERHGFVETDPTRGTGRERWWRATQEDLRTRGADFEDDPSAAEAYRLLDAEWSRSRRGRHEAWRASRREWPTQWREAAGESTGHLLLDVAETADLMADLIALSTRWAERTGDRREDDPRYRSVELQTNLFPNGRAPGEA
ncbi:Helix-turn-helix domain-containing protein [Nocardioides scoriae]|uniref:Helix-turn-helix domain-containing protein n=1 Tax=Nocardioides scoriae TaxID=642780 RepID=A0A1H1M2W2_9ACTN|nr:helix-turn-helix domain-containing protein [Nocardioides scoriae]SDR80685.1 Helix-turn-helix domain-containing protein [Nocardioides scoriae]